MTLSLATMSSLPGSSEVWDWVFSFVVAPRSSAGRPPRLPTLVAT